MLKAVTDMFAKLNTHSHKAPAQAPTDPLVAKMRNLSWAPTEDDRSALKYEIQSEQTAPLAEVMASSYLGHPTERFE